MAEKTVVAFFDHDKTVLDGTSGNIFGAQMYREGKLGKKEMLLIILYSLLYKLNRLPKKVVYGKVFEMMGKAPVEEMIEIMDRGFEELIVPRFFQDAVVIIREHKEKGHRTVIATAEGEYVAERSRAQLEADDVIATPLPIEGDRIVSNFDGPAAFMEEKLQMAREYCEKWGADLCDCYFYSDSASDLPLLEAVGHPVVVNPQVKLKREIRGRGWPVLKFSEHAVFEEVKRPGKLMTPDMDRFNRIYEEKRSETTRH